VTELQMGVRHKPIDVDRCPIGRLGRFQPAAFFLAIAELDPDVLEGRIILNDLPIGGRGVVPFLPVSRLVSRLDELAHWL
jgi:hypothetical protein